MAITDAIKKVVSKTNLSIAESCEVFKEIMEGKATDSQIAALITALRMKGETIDEITGAAKAMREKAEHVNPAIEGFLVDTCGTGGDGTNTFNISTAAALVSAGAGATVAKHGNRSVSSQSGSADVLEALGVQVTIDAGRMKECLDIAGICFLFAPALHKAMKYAAAPRKEIGVRTIFNILGPLTNPASSPNQLLGVFSSELTMIMAHVLEHLGSRRAFVVHGTDNLDEISIGGPTDVAELFNGSVRTYTITPEQFGFTPAPLSQIKGGSPQHNAQIIHAILDGQRGPCRDIVVLNAAFALAASGKAETPQEGLSLACQSIDSGAARDKLEQLISLTKAR